VIIDITSSLEDLHVISPSSRHSQRLHGSSMMSLTIYPATPPTLLLIPPRTLSTQPLWVPLSTSIYGLCRVNPPHLLAWFLLLLHQGANHTTTVTEITPHDPLYSRQFQCDEEILKEINHPYSPWDVLHHCTLFSPQESPMPPNQNPIYAVETKDFIPSGPIDWFNNPILAPDAFEEGNMANISPHHQN
jgi:hypothetical protein